MANIRVAVINASTILSDAQVKAAIAAFQTQVHRDFAPAWGIDADLIFVPKGGTPAAGSWWLTILDDSDQAGALGYFVQPTGNTGTLYAYEVCDACEADQYGYTIGATLVSDFVYPAWFESSRAAGSTQFDFGKHLQQPLPQLLPGGYIRAFDVGSGSGWHQVTAMRTQNVKGARRVQAPKGSRRDRRAIGRVNWKASSVRFG